MTSEIRIKYLPIDRAAPDVSRQGANAPGEPGTFTFRTRMPNVVEYVYTVNLDPSTRTTVPADPNGTATITWTPMRGGFPQINVQARSATGVLSDQGGTSWFLDDSPRVSSQEFPRNGRVRPGTTGTFAFAPRLPNTVAYEYSFDGGAYTSIPAGPDGTATLSWTAPAGDQTYGLRVRSRAADGYASFVDTYNVTVFNGPAVRSAEYPENQWSGGPGVAGTFTFSPGVPGVTGYVYQFRYQWGDSEPEQAVAADPSGAAGVTWTPAQAGPYVLVVRSRTVDGTLSGEVWYWFNVEFGS